MMQYLLPQNLYSPTKVIISFVHHYLIEKNNPSSPAVKIQAVAVVIRELSDPSSQTTLDFRKARTNLNCLYAIFFLILFFFVLMFNRKQKLKSVRKTKL